MYFIAFGIIVAIIVPLMMKTYIGTPKRKKKFLKYFYLFAAMTFFSYADLFYTCAQFGYDLLDMTNKPSIIYVFLFVLPFVPIILCLYFEGKKWGKK